MIEEQIKPSELRVGNHINYNGDEIEISAQDIVDMEYNPQDFKPIQLTEEWLVKFGLRGRKDFVWNNSRFGVQLVDGKFYGCFKDRTNVFYRSIVEIKYVHQLQNLYFALTNEELKITE